MRAVPIRACVLPLAIQVLRRVSDLVVIAAVGRGRTHDKRRGIWHLRDRRPLVLANGRRFCGVCAEHELGYRRDNDVPRRGWCRWMPRVNTRRMPRGNTDALSPLFHLQRMFYFFFFGCRMLAWDRSAFKPRFGCRCFQACVRLRCRVRKWPDATVCCAAEASDPRVECFADSCGHGALVNVAIFVSGTGSVNTSYVSLPATTLHFKDKRCLGM